MLTRRGRWRAAWRSPLLALTWRQRRSLVRQVRGRAPVDTERLPLLRDLARQIQQNAYALRGLGLLMGGQALVAAGNSIRGEGRWLLLLTAVGACVYLLAIIAMRRDLRRAAEFLARHPGGSGL